MASSVPLIKSPYDLYEEAKTWFFENNTAIVFDYNAKLQSFHSLYVHNSPVPVDGLTYPPNFNVLYPANEQHLKTLQSNLLNLDIDEELRDFLTPVLMYRAGRSSEITDHALGLESLKAQYHNKFGGGKYYLGIATSPGKCVGVKRSEVRAFVPELDWFNPNLQDLKFEDIIKIFPPAEAKMLKLILGRAVAGRTGSVHPHTDDVLTHGFRKAGVVVGEPGIGKTITLNGIIDAMKYLGYDVSSMGAFGSRFNQGSVISSHFAFNDDLNLETLEQMLKAHSFKSVVTGGTERVENKGVDAIEIVSNTVILANCNEWKSEMIYNIDAGAINRLAPIATLRQYELKEKSRELGVNVHPASYIKYLAAKYNCEPRALYIRALKDCLDYFMEFVNNGDDAVHAQSEYLIPLLRIQMHKNALDTIIRYAFMCYLIRVRNCKDDWIPELTLGSLGEVLEALRFMSIDTSAYHFRTLLKEDWIANNRELSHYWWAMRKILITSLDKAYEVYLSTKTSKDVALSTEEVFKMLRLKDGFAIGHRMTYIVRLWEQIKGERNFILKDAKRIMEKLKEDASLNLPEISARELERINLTSKSGIDKRCDSNYLYDPDYDPASL